MAIKYLAIDPGETVGLAGYNEDGDLQFLDKTNHKNLWNYLKQFTEVLVCIYEGYRVFRHKAEHHINSEITTVKVIGRIEVWAEENGIKLVKQFSNVKATGLQYLGKEEPPRSNPLHDAIMAHAHGTYWLVNNGILDPAKLLKKD